MYIGLHVKHPLFLQYLIKLEFSQKIFETFSKIEPHENQSFKRRVIACGGKEGRKDRHDEANILLSPFCERA
jgi:hypothetical protein